VQRRRGDAIGRGAVIETSHQPRPTTPGASGPPFGLLRLTIGDTGPACLCATWEVRDSTQQPRPGRQRHRPVVGVAGPLRLGRPAGDRRSAKTPGTVVEIRLPLAPPTLQRVTKSRPALRAPIRRIVDTSCRSSFSGAAWRSQRRSCQRRNLGRARGRLVWLPAYSSPERKTRFTDVRRRIVGHATLNQG
jgi:hypothetical protein